MTRARIFVALTVLAMVLSLAFAQGGKPKKATDHAAKAKGASKVTAEPKFAADKAAGAAKPAKKGGAKAKGAHAATELHIDNQTDFNINIYLDGEYIGSVSAYGDSYAWEPSGDHTLFARSAGGTSEWGPRSVYFSPGNSFTWTLDY